MKGFESFDPLEEVKKVEREVTQILTSHDMDFDLSKESGRFVVSFKSDGATWKMIDRQLEQLLINRPEGVNLYWSQTRDEIEVTICLTHQNRQ